MSKILQAVKRTGPSGGDYAFRLANVESMNLYPPPRPEQVRDFEQLANAVLNLHDGTRGMVITLTASVHGEGSSFISYNLARHLAYILGRKICWVDANFKSPQRKLAGHGVDFRTMLENPAAFSELKTGPNLVLVPNGDRNIRVTEALTNESYDHLLEMFRETFYFTFLDAPPILESIDVGRLAAPTEGAIVVIEARRLKRELVQHAVDELRKQHVQVLGSVLNRRTFDLPGFLYERL